MIYIHTINTSLESNYGNDDDVIDLCSFLLLECKYIFKLTYKPNLFFNLLKYSSFSLKCIYYFYEKQ